MAVASGARAPEKRSTKSLGAGERLHAAGWEHSTDELLEELDGERWRFAGGECNGGADGAGGAVTWLAEASVGRAAGMHAIADGAGVAGALFVRGLRVRADGLREASKSLAAGVKSGPPAVLEAPLCRLVLWCDAETQGGAVHTPDHWAGERRRGSTDELLEELDGERWRFAGGECNGGADGAGGAVTWLAEASVGRAAGMHAIADGAGVAGALSVRGLRVRADGLREASKSLAAPRAAGGCQVWAAGGAGGSALSAGALVRC